ncbi:MAG: complexin-2 [Clostridia bacterium]|nr:complexin-2 [Clostridia bacterium]
MKQIQIPEKLFIALVKYHLLDMENVQPEIRKGLMDKMDSITMRLLYSKYKTAPTEEEKENARKEYLDKRGVPNSFRW